jgi:hypothetical protein
VEAPEPKPNEATADQAEPEGLLYHYTDQAGLSGILKDDSIRATHYRFLNDTSERRCALDFLETTLRQLGSKERGAYPSSLLERTVESMNETFQRFDAYFVSFTQDWREPKTEGDRLSQWRGYSSSGPGFSLGFQKSRLMNTLQNLMNRPGQRLLTNLRPCVYCDQEKTEKAREVLQSYVHAFTQSACSQSPTPDNKDRTNLAIARIKFIDFCTQFKHYSFREEEEMRISVYFADEISNLDCIKFRDGKFGQIPYIEVPLGLREEESPLRRIFVGPSPNKDQAVVSSKIVLAQMGIKGIDVVPSQIPYRNW